MGIAIVCQPGSMYRIIKVAKYIHAQRWQIAMSPPSWRVTHQVARTDPISGQLKHELYNHITRIHMKICTHDASSSYLTIGRSSEQYSPDLNPQSPSTATRSSDAKLYKREVDNIYKASAHARRQAKPYMAPRHIKPERQMQHWLP